jgi:hypothetical protein
VFLHTQKTAGTTLINLARHVYKNDMITHGDYLALPKDELSKIGFVSGHFGYEYALPLIRSRYSFTFLRDPMERVLSFYYFCRKSDPNEYPIYQLAHELDLNEFLRAGLESPLVSAYLWNQQTWALACGPGRTPQPMRRFYEYPEKVMLDKANEHLADFSHVGFTETFETDRDVIFSALKLPAPQEKRVENATQNRPFKRDIPLSSLKLVEKLTQLDRELYATAWSSRWPNRRPA